MNEEEKTSMKGYHSLIDHMDRRRDISEHNKQVIKDFLEFRRRMFKCKPATLRKYLHPLKVMCQKGWISKNFEDLTKEDLMEIVDKIEGHTWIDSKGRERQYSPATNKNAKMALKFIIKYIHGDPDDPSFTPKMVRWLKCTLPPEVKRALPEHIIDREMVKKMASATTDPMELCYLWLVFESEARPQEARNIRRSDIKFHMTEKKECFMTVRLHGIKSDRVVPCLAAIEPTRRWLRLHPQKERQEKEQDFYLFVTKKTGRGNKGKGVVRISKRYGNDLLKRLAERVGIKSIQEDGEFGKKLCNYGLRKGRLTEMAGNKELSRHVFHELAGWVPNSTASIHYVRLSGKTTLNCGLKALGLDISEDGIKIENYIECPFCKSKEPPGALTCSKCFKPLVLRTADMDLNKMMVDMGKIKEDIKEVVMETVQKILKDNQVDIQSDVIGREFEMNLRSKR